MYKNLLPIEICQRIQNVYGKSMISVQHVRKWFRKFKSGRENIVGEGNLGRLISFVDKTFENEVDAIIQCRDVKKIDSYRL